MMRTSLHVISLAAGAFALAPAQAATQLGTIGGVINQLHDNGSLTPNGFSFSISGNGQSQTLFTGISGLHQYQDITGFNALVNPPRNDPPGWGNSYKFTYSALGSYFGNQTQNLAGSDAGRAPSAFSASLETGPVPEPATWGMMIAGFGVVGMALRRRNRRMASNFS